MKTVALADVLWDAANKHLGVFVSSRSHCVSPYSCDSVWYALGAPQRGQEGSECFYEARYFLRRLGCPGGLGALNNTPPDERQGVRYMWLLIAMHVAEDEGIMLEAPS